MTSLWLPAPTSVVANGGPSSKDVGAASASTPASSSPTVAATETPRRAPSYAERCTAAAEWRGLSPEERKKASNKPFVPRSVRDFDDGGAFPEIHVAQYPLRLGDPRANRRRPVRMDGNGNGRAPVAGSIVQSSAVVVADVDENGRTNYDAVVRQGTNRDKIVYTKHRDVKGGDVDPESLRPPTVEEEADTAARTQRALDALLSERTALARPTGSAMVNAAKSTLAHQEANTSFVRYTPDPNAPGYNPAAARRVIQMVPAQIDPMAPPKHEHKKAPRGPAEDPVPVLHAPPARLTKEEREAWNVPACVSNWKNSRGYTIPLDKRLAADGRGLREVSVNPNFATVAESLYVAERQAREEVASRADARRRAERVERDRRETELRELARRARAERTDRAPEPVGTDGNDVPRDDADADVRVVVPEEEDDNDEAAASAAAQRDRLRVARKKERERELRAENDKSSSAAKRKRLEDERDVSEKIALGAHTGGGAADFASRVDSRLYNKTAGLDAGFGREDEYNAYDKPLFDRDAVAKNIYRPTASSTTDADDELTTLKEGATTRFRPEKGFAGAERGGGAPRDGPVQFERSK